MIAYRNRYQVFGSFNGIHNASSLLLSPEMKILLAKKLSVHKNLRLYLRHLVFNYERFIVNGSLNFPKNGYRIYQDKNQNLEKVSFRPYIEDWLKLKVLAEIAGISVTYLFVYLLVLDDQGWGDVLGDFFGGVPTKSRHTLFLYSCKTTDYTNIFIQKVRLLL